MVSGKIVDLFRSGKITEMASTLDKVTVYHKSYTVLLTFFFFDGKIYCALNELILLAEDEYDSVGTARMVVRSLMETLGLTRTKVASLLVHFRFVLNDHLRSNYQSSLYIYF